MLEQMDAYYRKTLRDRSSDKPLFEHEEPRRDTGAKWAINLREGGSWVTELPYCDRDTNFYDEDPRGWNLEHDWKKYRTDNELRSKLTPWSSDQNLAVPGTGTSPEAMVILLQEMRMRLRDRLNWFSDSLGTIVTGSTVGAENHGMAKYLPQKEDKSEEIDPSIYDSIETQNIERLFSNNLHLGGRYFSANTTTDHVIPVASYNFLSGVRQGDQKRTEGIHEEVKTLTLKSRGRNFIKFLESYDMKKHVDRDGRIDQYLERQSAPSSYIRKDIMALLGLTQNDIKWLQSRENKTKAATKHCLANIVAMIQALEGVPANILSEMRTSLMREVCPEFRGGLSQSSINHNIRRILEERNRDGPKTYSRVDFTRESKPEHIISEHGRTVKNEHGIFKDHQHESVEDYTHISQIKNKHLNGSNVIAETDIDKANSIIDRVRDNIAEYNRIESQIDNEFSTEHATDYNLVPWSESHLKTH